MSRASRRASHARHLFNLACRKPTEQAAKDNAWFPPPQRQYRKPAPPSPQRFEREERLANQIVLGFLLAEDKRRIPVSDLHPDLVKRLREGGD